MISDKIIYHAPAQKNIVLPQNINDRIAKHAVRRMRIIVSRRDNNGRIPLRKIVIIALMRMISLKLDDRRSVCRLKFCRRGYRISDNRRSVDGSSFGGLSVHLNVDDRRRVGGR